MLQASDILSIEQFKTTIPPSLSDTDKAYVIGHLVALVTAGIPGDGSQEQARLERLIKQFAWRLGYCRYVEDQLMTKRKIVTYDTWVKDQEAEQ